MLCYCAGHGLSPREGYHTQGSEDKERVSRERQGKRESCHY